MSLLAVDLGGTKLAIALFSEAGAIKTKSTVSLSGRTGKLVGELIAREISGFIDNSDVYAIGVAVPGIYYHSTGTVWAPNIPGWDQYPLKKELSELAGDIPVVIDSDRACYISGEIWNGNAKGCSDAIFVAVGTGIGAGIISNNNIIRGADDIAGAIGWMGLNKPYDNKYDDCGCFEYHASGEGIRKVYLERIKDSGAPVKNVHQLTAHDVFQLYEKNDADAVAVLSECVVYWGMAIANLVSIFNPRKIIIGGGVFGPGKSLIEKIKLEAFKWAQPISMKNVTIESSALGNDAGLYGAAFLALQSVTSKVQKNGL